MGGADDSGGAVHQGWLGGAGGPLEGERLAGHGGRVVELGQAARGHGAAVGAEDHVGVEDGDQGVEVAASGGGQERSDDLALAGQVRIGNRGGAPDPAAGTAGELPGRRRERPTIGAISVKGTANMSCSTNASRSAGLSDSSTTSSANPTESATSACCSGSIPSASGR